MSDHLYQLPHYRLWYSVVLFDWFFTTGNLWGRAFSVELWVWGGGEMDAYPDLKHGDVYPLPSGGDPDGNHEGKWWSPPCTLTTYLYSAVNRRWYDDYNMLLRTKCYSFSVCCLEKMKTTWELELDLPLLVDSEINGHYHDSFCKINAINAHNSTSSNIYLPYMHVYIPFFFYIRLKFWFLSLPYFNI